MEYRKMVWWTYLQSRNTDIDIENKPMDTKQRKGDVEWVGRLGFTYIQSVQFSCSVMCLTLWDPMDCSTSGLPVITNSWSLLKLMSIESVMPSNHLILCHPLLLLPLIFPSIRVFSNENNFSHQVAKVLELQLQYLSLQWIFRTDFL